MRETQVKKLRRVARQMCNPQLTQMHARQYRIKARPVVDERGEPAIDFATGLPTIIPEQIRITAFWPNGSYRRILKSMKKWYHKDTQQRTVMVEMGARA